MVTEMGDPFGRYFYGYETEQDSLNVFDQSLRYSGQASEFPGTMWTRPFIHWSIPIPANLERPKQPTDLNAYFAAGVPRSGDGVGGWQIGARGSNQSDVPYVKLRAPRGFVG